ncbi:hypothetical protein KY290_013808 [Solanum tuberosum]|uniref:Ubiquitin-like protease family profile domain-containing protein n=1 Tax=Solanum tuberosum TaxID=4113 RepID=A0ABQ7VMS8_SOLTU|nr:hypothetical protein KY290_013808 [Solanum tuberosum]
MVKEDSSSEMEPHDEFVEMVTPVGEPNFHLLSPTPVSDSNCCNIQSVCVLPLSTIDHSGVDRQTEERSKEYLRRRKLEEIKKGKYIALDPKDQGRSVNVKRRKFIEVAPHKSKLKLKVRNISATLFEKSAMNLNDLVGNVVVNDESNGAEVASQLVDDDFTTPPPVSSKTSRKPKSVPPMNNMNLIDEIRRISDGQKELREDFQVLKQKVHSLKKLMMESDSKIFNAIEVLSQKFDRNNDSKYEEFRGRDVNVYCDEEYYENNINCDQHVTLHLDNIQTINEDSNNDVKIGASSKSIVTGVHPFGSFNIDVDCLKEMGEFREWMNEGRRPRNKKKGMHDDVPVKFTTTDYLFDLKIKALYKKFIENNGDSDVVKPEHDIAKYILGEFVFSNRPWHTVDHILFPLCVDEQWVMARLSFKDRSIYVYDSMGDAAFRANIRSSIDAYRFIIPLFLLILNFFEKRTDIQLNDGPYKNKALVDPFNVVMIEDLPLQQAADRDIYVALFAARFICGRNVFDNEFDVNTQRIKFGSLLWNYGKMKLEEHITSESKSSGIIKKMDCMKRYYN